MSAKDIQLLKKPNAEIITPHRLTLAILIHIFCKYRDSESFKNLKNSPLHCKYRRDFAVLSLYLLQRPDLSLLELRDLLLSEEYKIPTEVLNTFDETLANIYTNGTGFMLDSVDSFTRIIQSLNENNIPDPKCLPRILIAKNSVIGYYMRRLIVYFDNLTFSEVTGVYLAFQRYYEKWKNTGKSAQSTNDEFTDDWCSYQEQWSRRQAELFIATQAALLSNNEEKALSPIDLQKRISNLLTSNPELSEAHFLSYLNYARLKEFCGAVDSLYHCFDKCATCEKSSIEEKSKGQRYAALNLAILHYNFGHNEEALASLKEAIKISQEANDNVCLQQALSWLYRLTNMNKDKLIAHCTLKSFELNLTYTKSLGLQTFGKFSVQNSGNPQPIFEVLAKSDIINYQHNHRDLICNNYSMKSALWEFYGKTEMSSLWSQLFLFLNIDTIPSTISFYGESFCLSICNIANQLLLQGEYNLVHSILNFAKLRYPNEPQSLTWMLSENLFVFVRALNHEKWFEAENAAQKIMVINKFEGYLRLAELYYYKEDYIEAHRCINDLLNLFTDEDKSTYYYVRAKILLAEIQYSSAFPNIPAGIITILEDCLIETTQFRLDYYTALIHLHIANVQLLLGLTSQALKVLDKCLVQMLAHGCNFDRGRAMLLYVKCLVADSHKLDSKDRKKVILEAAELLNKVKDDFRKVEAFTRMKDVLYLQAQLYNQLNMNTARNRCACEFRQLEEEYVTKNSSTLVKIL